MQLRPPSTPTRGRSGRLRGMQLSGILGETMRRHHAGTCGALPTTWRPSADGRTEPAPSSRTATALAGGQMATADQAGCNRRGTSGAGGRPAVGCRSASPAAARDARAGADDLRAATGAAAIGGIDSAYSRIARAHGTAAGAPAAVGSRHGDEGSVQRTGDRDDSSRHGRRAGCGGQAGRARRIRKVDVEAL